MVEAGGEGLGLVDVLEGFPECDWVGDVRGVALGGGGEVQRDCGGGEGGVGVPLLGVGVGVCAGGGGVGIGASGYVGTWAALQDERPQVFEGEVHLHLCFPGCVVGASELGYERVVDGR